MTPPAARFTYRPQLATLVKQAPRGEAWVHELKFDGYRLGCGIRGQQVTLLSRRDNDWTAEFPELVAAARALKLRSAVLDGEVTIVRPDGRTSFHALQNAFSGAPRRGLVYWVFDLLELDGDDLTRLPLEERKRRLLALIGPPREDAVLRYSEHVAGGGPEVLERACAMGLEGVVSKRRDQPYRAGRSDGWVKTKCVKRQEFVIGGFTEPEAAPKDGIGALLVGVREGDPLRFAGKVGTGFTQRQSHALRERLDALAQKACPFSPRPEGWLGRNAHWVRPELVCEVAYTEWLEGGHLRHPSFQGLREDKRAREIERERPLPAPKAAPTSEAPRPPAPGPARRKGALELLGVTVTNPTRPVWPELGITKGDLARYHAEVADRILPHVERRPLTLLRCPQGTAGECVFMKHSRVWAPAPLRRVLIPEKRKVGEYLFVESAASLVALVQMDILELHTWNTRVEDVERPDRIVFDLDPGPEVAWKDVVAAAHLLRRALEALRLASFVKTTGGVGLHVVVPLVPERDWAECFAFSRALAEAIVREHPDRYTTRMPKAGREAKILIDYLRNNRTNTSVAAFSPRARPEGTVSMPVAWDTLTARLSPGRFTLLTVPKLLRRWSDPWKDAWRSRQRLSDAVIAAVR